MYKPWMQFLIADDNHDYVHEWLQLNSQPYDLAMNRGPLINKVFYQYSDREGVASAS